jgi:hypothetical protein
MWLVFDEAKASVVQQFLTTKYQWLDEFVTHITNIDLHHLKLYECRAGDGVHTHAAKCLGATVLKGANWELDHVGSRLTPPTGKDKEFQGQVWASLYGAKSHTSARRNIFTDLSLAFKHDRVSDSSKDGDAGDIWPISHSNIPDYEVTLIFHMCQVRRFEDDRASILYILGKDRRCFVNFCGGRGRPATYVA